MADAQQARLLGVKRSDTTSLLEQRCPPAWVCHPSAKPTLRFWSSHLFGNMSVSIAQLTAEHHHDGGDESFHEASAESVLVPWPSRPLQSRGATKRPFRVRKTFCRQRNEHRAGGPTLRHGPRAVRGRDQRPAGRRLGVGSRLAVVPPPAALPDVRRRPPGKLDAPRRQHRPRPDDLVQPLRPRLWLRVPPQHRRRPLARSARLETCSRAATARKAPSVMLPPPFDSPYGPFLCQLALCRRPHDHQRVRAAKTARPTSCSPASTRSSAAALTTTTRRGRRTRNGLPSLYRDRRGLSWIRSLFLDTLLKFKDGVCRLSAF